MWDDVDFACALSEEYVITFRTRPPINNEPFITINVTLREKCRRAEQPRARKYASLFCVFSSETDGYVVYVCIRRQRRFGMRVENTSSWVRTSELPGVFVDIESSVS